MIHYRLRDQATNWNNWPTAVASDADKRGHGENYRPDSRLAYVANRWHFPTPNATDGTKAPKTYANKNSPSLPSFAANFPTPSARDYKDWDGPGKKKPSRLYSAYSHLNQPTSIPGHVCSTKCRRLNPHFVELLMGWPGGWTLLTSGQRGSELLGMELSHWLARMRFALSMLG